jgi:outer membrane PBP1 activator LpoA protein
MSGKTYKLMSIGLIALFLSHCATSSTGRKEFAQSLAATPQQSAYFAENLMPGTTNKIALLLPLSGSHQQFARVIQEGFLYAYFQAKQHTPNLSVQVYDTSSNTSVSKLYQQAIDEGAQFIVGPLSKNDVDAIATLSASKVRVPTLLLNQPSNTQELAPGLFVISLTPEYETQFVATTLVNKGLKNAALLASQDAMGDRMATSFAESFKQAQGRNVAKLYVTPKMDKAVAIQELLALDLSQKRYQTIQQLLKRKIEFQPRRRQDLDAIVMMTTPEQARELKPLIDFYYAENLPVYASSMIYQGEPSPKKDRDLNGVTFCDIPLLLSLNPEWQRARTTFYQTALQTDKQYPRLYALGIDSFTLSQQLKTVFSAQKNGLPAATGTLFLDNHNTIYRKLSWATMKEGKAVPIQQ